MGKKLLAEGLGTFWLVFGGCGSAVLAAAFPDVGIGLLGVSAAFGLTVLTMAYAIGHVSGCHLNPAVSAGLWAGGRFEGRFLAPYMLAQVAGAIAAAVLLLLVASGKPGFDLAGGLAANGVGEHSPGGYSMTAGLVMEVVMTAMFLVIIMGATDRRAPAGFEHSGHQHVGQPGAQHRASPRHRRMGPAAAVDLLGGATDRRRAGRRRLPPVRRRADGRRGRGPTAREGVT